MIHEAHGSERGLSPLPANVDSSTAFTMTQGESRMRLNAQPLLICCVPEAACAEASGVFGDCRLHEGSCGFPSP
jgi:hypothetical protein